VIGYLKGLTGRGVVARLKVKCDLGSGNYTALTLEHASGGTIVKRIGKDLPIQYFHQIALAVDTDGINAVTPSLDSISAMAALFFC
jgi:hypothetical protein